MYSSRRLYFVALIMFLCLFWYNLVHFDFLSILYTKSYSFSIEYTQKQWFKQSIGPILNSSQFNEELVFNLTKENAAHQDDNTYADNLEKQVRVLIWIMTMPKYHETRAKAVKETWGKHCEILIFFSSQNDPNLPSIGLNVNESYGKLTPKTMKAFRYLYDNHFNDADWFMKVDDDTFVIVENLRYFLSQHNPNDPLYFGHHFQAYVEQVYHSGGAGYVISKEALRRFGESWNRSKVCDTDGWAEDKEIGKCMQNLNVKISDSRDALGRSRFNCFSFKNHLLGLYPDWYLKKYAYGAKKGLSDYAIPFHYTQPDEMYALEYFVYHLRPYGMLSGLPNLNRQ